MKHTHCIDGLLPTSHMTMMVGRTHPSWNLSTLLVFTHCFSSWILALGRQMSRVGINLPASCKPHFHVHTSATSFYVDSGSGTKAFKGIGRGWTRWLVALPWHQNINSGYLCTVSLYSYSVIMTKSLVNNYSFTLPDQIRKSLIQV